MLVVLELDLNELACDACIIDAQEKKQGERVDVRDAVFLFEDEECRRDDCVGIDLKVFK